MSIVKEGPYKTVSITIAAGATALWYWALSEMHLVKLPGDSLFGWPELGWSIAGFALTVFFAFRWLFEKWLWRWKIFAGLLNVPDLSGAWSGELESVTIGRVHHNVVTIKHQVDRLQYESRRQEHNGRIVSSERTIACTVRRSSESQRVELVLAYANVAGLERDEFGYDHEGCAILDLLGEGGPRETWILQGKYWTNKKDPRADEHTGTQGKVTLRWAASLQAWQDGTLQKKLYALTTTANVSDVPTKPRGQS